MTENESAYTVAVIGNRKVKNKIQVLCNFIHENKHKKFFICSHDNPDPDAIASAMGMRHILEFLDVQDIDLVYCGEISHPQNRAMVNVLNIPLRKWRSTDEQNDAVYIFVDCVGQSQKNMSIHVDPTIVIDHHKIVPAKGVLSIHDEVGACATLVADLMFSIPARESDGVALTCFDPDLDGIKEIATALAVGIKTDTLDFRSETTSDEDFQAYKNLTKFMSDDKFTKIINYELPPYMFDFEEIAWRNKRVEPPTFITGLRYVDPKQADCIPYLADKYMRLPGVQTVVVYGIVGNSVRGSIRTTATQIDCGALCDEIFGEGNGGAKQGSGGALVQFSVFDTGELSPEELDKFWDITQASIERKFMKATKK